MKTTLFEQEPGKRRPVPSAHRSESPAADSAGVRPRPLDARSLLSLQRTAGNAAVAALMQNSGRTVQRQEPQSGPGGTGGSAPTTLPRAGWIAPDPAEFFRLRPSLAQPNLLSPLPAPAVTGLIDWSGLSATFQTRGLTLGTGDQGVIVEHWKRWYPVAQALYRLPLASTFFDGPAGIMNSLSSTMVDTTLAGDHPNPIERFNLEAERFGVSTTTVSLPALHF